MSAWKHDPGLDPEGDEERAGKRAEAFEAAREAAAEGDWSLARELAAVIADEARTAEGEDRTAEILDAPDIVELLKLAPPEALATATDWTGDPEPRGWLAPDWLPSGRAALFTGPGGGGKSLFALQLAAGIAVGDRNPFRCDPRGVQPAGQRPGRVKRRPTLRPHP